MVLSRWLGEAEIWTVKRLLRIILFAQLLALSFPSEVSRLLMESIFICCQVCYNWWQPFLGFLCIKYSDVVTSPGGSLAMWILLKVVQVAGHITHTLQVISAGPFLGGKLLAFIFLPSGSTARHSRSWRCTECYQQSLEGIVWPADQRISILWFVSKW